MRNVLIALIALFCGSWSRLISAEIFKLDTSVCANWNRAWTAPHVRQCCELLKDDNSALLSFLSHIESIYGHLNLDSQLPSLYTFKSVALFAMHRMHEAGMALNEAVKHNPADARAWYNLAEIRSMIATVGDKHEAFDKLESLTGIINIAKRYQRVMWEGLETHQKENENAFLACLNHLDNEHCENGRMSSSIDMAELNGTAKVIIQKYFSRNATAELDGLPDLTHLHASIDRKHPENHLVVGFLLAVLDSGPVNALTQSLLRRLDRRRCTVVGFVLSGKRTVLYDWMGAMLRSFDEIISLDGLSNLEEATVIANYKVDVLIDMNGFNYITGIHTMKYRPCPIQINFLGDPITAALSFMDYYVGDVHANAPDITAAHFTERLALLSTSYLANSHLEATPDLLLRPRQSKQSLHLMTPHLQLHKLGKLFCKNCELMEPMLFGAFHTHAKFDPTTFNVWMNILRRVPPSAIVFAASPTDPLLMQNLVAEAATQGIAQPRVLFLALTQWHSHLHHKTALDLYLDTVRKNGHTTTVDAAWAGLPTVALGGERTAGRRSAESVLHATAENSHGVVYSLKEYEDLAVALTSSLRGRRRLASWRRFTDRARLKGDLFDPVHFADKFLHSLQSIREVKTFQSKTLYNVFQTTEE